MDKLRYMFSAKVIVVDDPCDDSTSSPTAHTHPLVLELHNDSRDLESYFRQTLLATKIDNVQVLHATFSELDLFDGSTPRPLVHVGFSPAYLAASGLVHEPRSEQLIHLLSLVRRVRLEPSTEHGRNLMFHSDKLTAELHAAFEEIDVDGSGGIDLNEIEKLVPNHHRALAILKEYDVDGNGIVDFDEWNRHSLLDFAQRHQILVRYFVRHDHKLRDELNELWSSKHKFGLTIPRPNALNYFGPECTMYFEFVTFYTWALVLLAAVGAALVVFQKTSGPWMLGFALFTGVWSSFCLALWSQRQFALEKMWSNVVDATSLPSFELWRPRPSSSWLRLRRGITVALSAVVLIVVFSIDLKILHWKISLDGWLAEPEQTSTISRFEKFFWAQLPSACKAIVMTTFDEVFKKIVQKMILFEKRSSSADEQDSRMAKLVGFQFVSKFMYLFYFAFVMQDIPKLKKSLLTVLVVSLFVQNAKEMAIPWLKTRWKEASLLANRNKYYTTTGTGKGKGEKSSSSELNNNAVLTLTHLEEDYFHKEYSSTFEDYLEMLLQFGQIMLFASVFPLGGALALLNNLVEVRGDAFKMIDEMNPMIPRDERLGDERHHFDINLFVSAFTGLSFLSIVTNLLLLSCDEDPDAPDYNHWMIGYEYPSLPGHRAGSVVQSSVEVIFLMCVLEHMLLFVKGLVMYMLPERDGEVSTHDGIPLSVPFVLLEYRSPPKENELAPAEVSTSLRKSKTTKRSASRRSSSDKKNL